MKADAALTDGERIARLRLIRSESIGPVTFRELIEHFGTASAALEAVPDLARRGGRRLRLATEKDAEGELAAVDAIGARLVAIDEPGYPPWLRSIDGAPPLLTCRGEQSCVTRASVAIVGSRNASVAGRRFAMQIAGGLSAAGYAVASGLARGIDAAAHAASLDGGTIAVFAGGLDRPYPPENLELAAQILDRGGAHVSEMSMGHEPRAKDFPRRNRIISGLSVGVVVIEAAMRSGSLITARLAGEQGRLVFAAPGSPLDPRAAGANQLIKDGAIVVTSVDDVVAEIRPMMAEPSRPGPSADIPPTSPPTDADDQERARIIEAMGPTPVEVDEIIRFTRLGPAVVRLVLLELDLAGRIEHHGGGRVSLIS